MRVFLIFTVLLTFNSSFSQNEKSNLLGKWIFNDFKTEGLSKQQINDLNEMKPMFENSFVIYNEDFSCSQVNARGKELKGKYTIEKDKIKIVFNNGNKSEQTFKLINDELMFFDYDFGIIYKRDKSFIEKKASTE